MTYVLGGWDQISWPKHTHVDSISEIVDGRFWAPRPGGVQLRFAKTANEIAEN